MSADYNRNNPDNWRLDNNATYVRQKTLKQALAPDERVLFSCGISNIYKKSSSALKTLFKTLSIILVVLPTVAILALGIIINFDYYYIYAIAYFIMICLIVSSLYTVLNEKPKQSNNVMYFVTNKQVMVGTNTPKTEPIILKTLNLKDVTDIKLVKINSVTQIGTVAVYVNRNNITMHLISDAEYVYTKIKKLFEIIKENLKTAQSDTRACEYCDSFFASSLKHCPNCGAPNPFYKDTENKTLKDKG